MKKNLGIQKIFVLLLLVFAVFAFTGCKQDPTLTFANAEISVVEGDEFELQPQIQNLTGTDLVVYSFNLEGIVELSGSKFVAKAPGVVVITGTLKDYTTISASVTVTVTAKETVKVTGVTVAGNAAMTVGAEQTLTATVTPTDAADKTVTWTSSDATVATVSSTGIVKALKAGSVTVTATANDGSNVKGELAITVTDSTTPVEVSLDITTAITEAYVGDKITIEYTLTGSDSEVVWTVNNNRATFEGNVATITSAGSVTITATLASDATVTDSITFRSYGKVAGITLSGSTEKRTFAIGETEMLFVDITPTNAKEAVTWSTSDANVATVDQEGTFTCVGGGTVNIIATATDGSGVYGEYSIRVLNLITDIVVTGQPTMNELTSQTLTLSYVPMFTAASATFTSSNPEVATVSAAGVVSALVPGKTTITVKANDAGAIEVTYEIEVLEVVAQTDVTLASPAVADLQKGAEYTYNGIVFNAGINAFASLKQAVDTATTRTYVAAGTYADTIDITKEGFELIGPNSAVDPNRGTRLDEAILTGTINIQTLTNNVTIVGLAFTGDATIKGTGQISDFTFSYNNVYDISQDPSFAWLAGRLNTTVGFLSIINSSNTEQGEDYAILNNRFEGMGKIAVMVSRLERFTVRNNVFKDCTFDGLRVEGGYNCGEFLIENNEFVNETLGGQNGIFFQSYSNNAGHDIHTITIQNNTFRNLGDVEQTILSGAISFNFYQEQGGIVNILFNTFENCANYLHVRNNGAVADGTYTANINYNYFKGIPTAYYHKSFSGTDTDATNPPLANMDLNYFEDADGNPITDLTPHAALFQSLASYKDNYQTKAAYEEALKQLLGVDVDMVVNGAWAELADGTQVELDGFTWEIGVNAFATVADAIEAVQGDEGAIIKFAPGTYSEAITILKNNITFLGENYNVNPVVENRFNEATYSAVISVQADGFTMNGFELTGGAGVLAFAGISDITFIYNSISRTSQDGIVRAGHDGTATEYVKNLVMSYNYSSAYGANRFLNANLVDGLVMINNDITTTGFDFINANRLRGTVVISGNRYVGSQQSFILARGVGVIDATIEGNYLENIANTNIDFRGMNENGNNVFTIRYNTFVNSGSGWCPLRIRPADYDENDTITVNVNYNKFLGTSYYLNTDTNVREYVENPVLSTQVDPFKVIYNMDYNYFEGVTELTADNFAGAALSWANAYTNEEDVPGYTKVDDTKPTAIQITNKVEKLDALTTYQLAYTLTPSGVTNKKVGFSSSDSSVATVSAAGLISTRSSGTCTITVYSIADQTVLDTMEFSITEKERIEIRYDGTGVLEIHDQLQLAATLISETEGTLTYTSSDTAIATVSDAGLVTAIASGQVTITVTSGELSATVSFTIVNDIQELDPLIQALIAGNNGVVLNQVITYIGSDDGSADYPHNIYGSVNDFWNGTLPEMVLNMLPETDDSIGNGNEILDENDYMSSIEFIVIHDTAGSGSTSTARANSGWCTNSTNSGSSWHYTIGNDGLFKQLDDNIIAWHAGDGISWGRSTTMHDTGVAYEGDRPTVTIEDDGFYYINGKKSLVTAPTDDNGQLITKEMNTLGMICVKGENGNYLIPSTHVGSGYGGVVCARGGNNNGIGIETAVNMTSDVYLTWQMTAKFVAQLLVTHDLLPDRVWFHNNFSNKPCPRTMMTAELVDMFLEMVYLEYEVAKNYSGYTIKFESDNPAIIDGEGRVVEAPEYTTNVGYTVTVTDANGNETSIKLNSLVIGQYNS